MKSKLVTSFLILFIFAIFLFFPVSKVFALDIQIHIPEKYTTVLAGERLYFILEILYPENPSRKDLRLEYEILENGKVIAQSKFLKAIEAQSSFMDYVVVPKNATRGLHEIQVKVIDYDNLSEIISSSFLVERKSSAVMLYFYIILGVIIISAMVIIWEVKKLKKSL